VTLSQAPDAEKPTKSLFLYGFDMALKADAFEAISFPSVNISFPALAEFRWLSGLGTMKSAESGYAINSAFVQDRMLEWTGCEC